VVSGRKRPALSVVPWLTFSLVAVVAFIGLVITRTALDRSAIELATLERRIAEETSVNQRLRLEIARLESPARVAPLAEAMGMVYPERHHRLVVAGVIPEEESQDPRWASMNNLAAPTLSGESTPPAP
jgi:cell division protein FtsL